jgi:hypothetical protein
LGNGGHCSTIITNLLHLRWALAWVLWATFWSFHLCTAITFPKMQVVILACSWRQRPISKVESFACLTFSTTKPCIFLKCLVNNHLTQYVTM